MRGIKLFAIGLFAAGMFLGNVLPVNIAYGGGPPQPYYADYVMGNIELPGNTSRDELRVVACISGCNVYETEAAPITEDGSYKLALHPEDRRLAGRLAIIYLLNDHGRIKANEVVSFSGGFETHQLDLTFDVALPVAPDAADLPVVGDELIPLLPKYAIAFGISAILVGFILSNCRFTRKKVALKL